MLVFGGDIGDVYSSVILQRIFLGIWQCFLFRESHSLLCVDQCVKSRMVNLKTNMMCETFHKQDSKKKQTLKYLVDYTLNSKLNVQLVNGKSAKCLSLLRNQWWCIDDVDDDVLITQSVCFHHCQRPSFPIDWWWIEFI